MCCWPRCTGPSSPNAAFALHLPLRCARLPVVRPWLYHGVGAPTAPLGAPTLRCAPPQSPKRTPPRFTLIVVAQNTRRYGHPCWSTLVPSGWEIGPNCVLRLALFVRLWAGEPEFLL